MIAWWPSGGLWRHPDFLRLWSAQAASAIGSRVTRTALPMIAILTIGASPTEIAVLSALGVAPGVVVGLIAGGAVDRRTKRPILIGADLVRALLILTIPVAAWSGALAMAQLYAVAAAVGAATALFRIADASFLPALVEPGLLVEGNAKLEATDSIAEGVGPGLAGLLIQLLTAPVAMIVDAVSYLWSALLLSRIRSVERPAAAVQAAIDVVGDIKAGFRACVDAPPVGRTLLAETLMSLFGGFFFGLYMILTLETLALSPVTVGAIIGVGGLGSFVGALIAEPLARRLGVGAAMTLALGIGQAAMLLVPLAEFMGPPTIPCLVLHQLVGDAFLSTFLIHAVSLRQRTLPADVLARANATFHVATGLTLPAGALIAGSLAEVLGVSPTMWVGAVGGLSAVFALRIGLARPR